MIETIAEENLTVPGGSVDGGTVSFTVRVPGEFDDPSIVGGLVVAAPENKPVYVRDLADVRITEGVFRERLTLLHSALGLAAYNAGMSNLLKAGKRRNPFKTLSFPLQITENRNYVDDILDGSKSKYRNF